MYKEILYPEQIHNLNILELFSEDFYLAGGTAIALQLGHRKSIDFDLFSSKVINISQIRKKLHKNNIPISHVLVENKGEEFTIIIRGTKFTFLYYPFEIALRRENTFGKMVLPNLETLGAMKLYTLGRRGKWKDYVDIFFLSQKIKLENISQLAEKIFGGGYNEKLMREQLCYFDDIDFSEEVDFLDTPVSEEEIQIGLKQIATKN